ncbi:MAG: Hsp20/alpha crystallin family protein [Parcubacteria group bacterium]|nr:Hsp20/alpha crystallin family protein [Parcubacteria group bacterium]
MDDKAKKFFQDLIGKEETREAPVAVKTDAAEDDGEDAAAPVKTAKKTTEPVMAKKPKEEDKEAEMFEESEGQLTIDVYQTPTEIVIQSTIAGVSPENLDIAITNESVTIKGKRERSETVKEEDYFYQECYWGRFSRSIILPQEIDADQSTAIFKNGVLTIRLPKVDKRMAKKLKVKFD